MTVNYQIKLLQTLFPVSGFPIFSIVSFAEEKFLILMKFNLPVLLLCTMPMVLFSPVSPSGSSLVLKILHAGLESV